MPQETNLNVAPYFDDFEPQSNYYKVLFKPGYPVQARELTTLQSILQNQVEDVGNHLFKEVLLSFLVAHHMSNTSMGSKSKQNILESLFNFTLIRLSERQSQAQPLVLQQKLLLTSQMRSQKEVISHFI